MDKELLIYNYFSNGLSKREEQQFNELMRSDPDFKAQFNFENDLKRAIKNNENEHLKAKLVGFEREITKETPVRTLRPNYQKWAMAASIVLLVGLGWLGYKSMGGADYQDLYNINFEAYPNTVYTITRGDTSESLERDAFAAYESGDFQNALNNFERITEVDQKSYFDFYKAQSYLNMGDNQKASELFKKVIGSGAEFEAEAQWYLALSYLKAKDVKNARAALQKLTTNYSYNKEKALALLSELN